MKINCPITFAAPSARPGVDCDIRSNGIDERGKGDDTINAPRPQMPVPPSDDYDLEEDVQ